MIKVITFDLDDTLWDVAPVITRANAELYDWLNHNAPRFTERYGLEDFGTLRRRVVARHPEWAHSVTAVRLAVLKTGLADCDYAPDEVEALGDAAFACFLQARNQVEFFQHSLAILDTLGRDYQLGALSNGNADIELVGLGEHFDFCFNADRVGTAKPDPLMFRQMLEFTGVDPDQVIHVGDHPEHDVLGAQNAGVHSLWVNFDRKPWPGGPAPDLEVSCLSEIPAAIRAFDTPLGDQG